MIAWILFFVVCFIIGVTLAQKIESTFKKRRLVFTLAETSVIWVFCAAIPFASPFFVEFPTFVGSPTIVTFKEDGNLVYHRLGLWTPPWNNMEVANVPTECERLSFYSHNSSTIFDHDGKIFIMEFDGDLCVSDPKKYFSDKSRRRQSRRMSHKLESEVRRSVFLVHTRKEDELKRLAVASNCFTGDTIQRQPCPRVTDFIFEESGIVPLLNENGVTLKHTTTVTKTGLSD
ncbi:MAG: hypothetical protein RL536_469 [Candidatus Parcubacteria bacterium]